jgi:hypothetical protein
MFQSERELLTQEQQSVGFDNSIPEAGVIEYGSIEQRGSPAKNEKSRKTLNRLVQMEDHRTGADSTIKNFKIQKIEIEQGGPGKLDTKRGLLCSPGRKEHGLLGKTRIWENLDADQPGFKSAGNSFVYPRKKSRSIREEPYFHKLRKDNFKDHLIGVFSSRAPECQLDGDRHPEPPLVRPRESNNPVISKDQSLETIEPIGATGMTPFDFSNSRLILSQENSPKLKPKERKWFEPTRDNRAHGSRTSKRPLTKNLNNPKIPRMDLPKHKKIWPANHINSNSKQNLASPPTTSPRLPLEARIHLTRTHPQPPPNDLSPNLNPRPSPFKTNNPKPHSPTPFIQWNLSKKPPKTKPRPSPTPPQPQPLKPLRKNS